MADQQDIISSKLDATADVASKRASFFSFGDKGLTATVGASGRLLRISRHFPGEKVGFCVDDVGMPEPYFAEKRREELLSRAEDTLDSLGIGARVDASNQPDDSRTRPADMVNHRWPTFHRKLDDGTTFKLQYAVSDSGDTIYQSFELGNHAEAPGGNKSVDRSLPQLTVASDLLIRNLDFVDADNDDNEADEGDVSEESRPNNNIIMRQRKSSGAKVVLRIFALAETNPLKFVDCSDSQKSSYAIRWDTESSELAVDDLWGHRIILAYTLEYVPKRHYPLLNVTWESASETLGRLLTSSPHHTLVENSSLNDFLLTNVEYILSVCSIPVGTTTDETRIALTCGDVDNHQVATAASFYSFQLLLLGWRHLDKSCNCTQGSTQCADSSAKCTMMTRIERVCKGHMEWLFKNALLSSKAAGESAFCPNYWASGEEIRGWRDIEYLPAQSPVDTALQIIKAGDFHKTWNEPCYNSSVESIMKKWIEDMDETTNWEYYMFPRGGSGSKPNFHLTDHALIWLAIKSTEDMGLLPESQFADRDYSSRSLQQHMREGFTVSSEPPTMAVRRRCGLDEFSLTPREAALIRAMESGFLSNMEAHGTIGKHENISQHQACNEHTDAIALSDPLSLAMSILQKRLQTNLESESDVLHPDVIALVERSSANGLFFGNLNHQDPSVVYENSLVKDNYWSNVFAIPYIIWKCWTDRRFGTISQQTPSDRSATTIINGMIGNLNVSSCFDSDISAQMGGLAEQDMQTRTPAHPNSPPHTHSNSGKSPRLISMTAPEKDLFSYAPVFFVPRVTNSPPEDEASDHENTRAREQNRNRKWSELDTSAPLKSADDKKCDGVLVDLQKSNRSDEGNEITVPLKIQTHRAVRKIIDKGRSPQTSQKRFWAFFSHDPSQNNACLRTISARQRRKDGGMNAFFRRHRTYANMVSEEIKPSPLNTWKTEFHLTTYHIFSKNEDFKEKDLRTFARGVISFAFEGDLTDQYWTCRFLESNPHWGKEFESPDVYRSPEDLALRRMERLTQIVRSLLRNGDMISNNNIRISKDAWHEHKVLELILLCRAVQKIQMGANNVLEVARLSVRDLQSKYTQIEKNYDVFVLRTKRIQNVLEVLQTVKGGLDENLEEISLWQQLRKDRQGADKVSTVDTHHVQEAKMNLKRAYQVHLQEIRRVRSRITKFELSTSRMLEHALSEAEGRREDNIRQFTYVTVVFLPLGFATGLFSMSGSPASGTLKSMTITAIVALTITALLLLSAGFLRKGYFLGLDFLGGLLSPIITKVGNLAETVIVFVVFESWLAIIRLRRWIRQSMPSLGRRRGRLDEENLLSLEW